MVIKTIPTGPLDANCHIVIDEKTGHAAIIDPGGADERIFSYLEESNISSPQYILLTHGHFDHINGVAALKGSFPGAKICIHEKDAPCLSDDLLSMSRGFGLPPVEKVYPDITLKEGDCLPFGEGQIKVIHTPGHTKGGVVYMIEDCLFTGDTLFCLTVGRSDFPGGDPRELNDSLNRLFDLPGDYKVYTGHNRSTTLNTERTKNIFVRRKNR